MPGLDRVRHTTASEVRPVRFSDGQLGLRIEDKFGRDAAQINGAIVKPYESVGVLRNELQHLKTNHGGGGGSGVVA